MPFSFNNIESKPDPLSADFPCQHYLFSALLLPRNLFQAFLSRILPSFAPDTTKNRYSLSKNWWWNHTLGKGLYDSSAPLFPSPPIFASSTGFHPAVFSPPLRYKLRHRLDPLFSPLVSGRRLNIMFGVLFLHVRQEERDLHGFPHQIVAIVFIAITCFG